MMPPVGKREVWIAGILGFLAVLLVVGFHFYDVGKREVALKATQDSLSVVEKVAKGIEKSRDSLAIVLLAQSVKTDSTRTVYIHDKAKVALHGDTAVTKDSSQVLLPEVADKLRADDAHIANLEAENATLHLTLGVDSTLIRNQAEQIRLNQNIAKMVHGPSHFSHGIQIGVGETLSSHGVKRASIYVGYGVQIRTP